MDQIGDQEPRPGISRLGIGNQKNIIRKHVEIAARIMQAEEVLSCRNHVPNHSKSVSIYASMPGVRSIFMSHFEPAARTTRICRWRWARCASPARPGLVTIAADDDSLPRSIPALCRTFVPQACICPLPANTSL